MTTEKFKDLLKSQLLTNTSLIQRGNRPVCYNVQGSHGIGKTSIVKSICKELEYQFAMLNLANIDDLGNLVGYPYQSIEMVNDGGNVVVIREREIDSFIKLGYKATGKSSLQYSAPEWLTGMNEGPGVLFLDDYTRAAPFIMQATMSLVENLGYISWSLPNGWMIVLSTNPDGEDYSVSSLDAAQRTRFCTLDVTFSVDSWLNWAETVQFDPRVLTFVQGHKELFAGATANESGVASDSLLCARSMTMFFNAISEFPNYSSALDEIRILGEGTVGTHFTNEFLRFITEGLDLLPSPEVILSANEADCNALLDLHVGAKPDGSKRAVSSILIYRLTTYVMYSPTATSDLVQRWKQIILQDRWAADQRYYAVARCAKEGSKSPNKDHIPYGVIVIGDPTIQRLLLDNSPKK